MGKAIARHVSQVRIAHRGILVPSEHGIDGLTEGNGVRIIDTARVYPDILVAMLLGLFAAPRELDWTVLSQLELPFLRIAEAHLVAVIAPRV